MHIFHIFKKILLVIAVLLITAQTGQTDNRVVVIPLVVQNNPLKNIVTVAKENGDFSNPIAAINSIVDADEANPYLVVIAPGVYNLASRMIMKSHVDVMGSGTNVTSLIVSTDSVVVEGASYSTLSEMTIENTTSAIFTSIGISSSNTYRATYKNLIVTVSGSDNTNHYGIFIHNNSGNVGLEHVTTQPNYFRADTGIGIKMLNNENITIKNVYAYGNPGLQNTLSMETVVRNSFLLQPEFVSGMIKIYHSTILLGYTSSTPNRICMGCDNGANKYLAVNCDVIP